MHSSSDGPRGLDELLLAVAEGDRDAFSDLYDEIAATVYGLARKVVVDPSRAQEIAQDALLEVWRKAGDFDPGRGSPITWIAVMTRRRAIDVVRSSESSRSREEKVIGVAGDDPDPVSEVVVSLDERRQVRRAMASLTDLQRREHVGFFVDFESFSGGVIESATVQSGRGVHIDTLGQAIESLAAVYRG